MGFEGAMIKLYQTISSKTLNLFTNKSHHYVPTIFLISNCIFSFLVVALIILIFSHCMNKCILNSSIFSTVKVVYSTIVIIQNMIS